MWGTDFDAAQRGYEQLRESDPFRIDGMDNYSNILYVKEAKVIMGVHVCADGGLLFVCVCCCVCVAVWLCVCV